ncbi:MAG: hypothetical protein UT32_C0018G0047 [Parcubacteria group bacterium GW2011_GWC2_39_14]|nr:MAG: hypothetical protein UT32_C0018G0047 [Parcubacteria group bacterium GW2011_GWC2_39_14]KKR54754.1 MAG: hypothetical protein UT91_C0010G0047 [Parcubacteria group bacterium GW2011_GWA2_40_23]
MQKVTLTFKPWKILSLLVIFVYGLSQMRGPLCLGSSTCTTSFIEKALTYLSSVILPGITQLMRDNGFFVGYKTNGLWDAIPQFIVHVGIDILYWYLIICFISFIVRSIKKLKH